MFLILSVRDSSNLLLRCLVFGFFLFEFINFVAGLPPQWRALMLGRKQMRERVFAENTDMYLIQTEDRSAGSCATNL